MKLTVCELTVCELLQGAQVGLGGVEVQLVMYCPAWHVIKHDEYPQPLGFVPPLDVHSWLLVGVFRQVWHVPANWPPQFARYFPARQLSAVKVQFPVQAPGLVVEEPTV